MLMIGLTCSARETENGQQLLESRDYTDAILRAGALPVMLPRVTGEEAAREVLRRADAMLFTGGSDVDPALYGQQNTYSAGIDPERDSSEMLLLRLCLAEGKPFLAICRGVQIMNVALGGTLWQDMEKERPGSLFHPRYNVVRECVHGVTLKEGSLLAAVLGKNEIGVNSRHHQAVKLPGRDVLVCANAEDGLIEAIELPREVHSFALGVQWHPENLAPADPTQQRLFDALVSAAGK